MVGGIGYSAIRKDKEKTLEYGLNGYAGAITETSLSTNIRKTTSIYGIQPFIRSDYKWFGVGGGLHVGSLKLTPFYWTENATPVVPKTGIMNTFIYPQLYVRAGWERYLFVAYHLGDQFPVAFPAMYNYMELGSGFGLKNGMKLSLGVNMESASMLKLCIPIKNKVIIEPVFQWQRSNINTTSDAASRDMETEFLIGIQYLLK
jgi:hypothetical protein